MKDKVTHQKKCMLCNNVESFIMRDKNVNVMADRDVYFIISQEANSPYETGYCGHCKQQTLQMHVGWKY